MWFLQGVVVGPLWVKIELDCLRLIQQLNSSEQDAKAVQTSRGSTFSLLDLLRHWSSFRVRLYHQIFNTVSPCCFHLYQRFVFSEEASIASCEVRIFSQDALLPTRTA
jgi:hypothetical protein